MNKLKDLLNLLVKANQANAITEPFKSEFEALLKEIRLDLSVTLMRKTAASVTPLIALMSAIEADLKTGTPANGKMEAWKELVYAHIEAAMLFRDCKGNLEYGKES
jgi:hypothetical protein